MEEERELILKLVAEGKITADEADALLQALEEGGAWEDGTGEAGDRSPAEENVREVGPFAPKPNPTASGWPERSTRRERIRVEGAPDLDQLGKMLDSIMNRVGDELKHIPDHLARLGVSFGGQKVTVERSSAWSDESGPIRISNPWGDVTVEAWGEQRVEAQADFRLPIDPERRNAEPTLEERGLIFEQAAGGLRIEVAQKPRGFGRKVMVGLIINNADLRLRVPRGSRIEVTAAGGDISLRGDLAELLAETASGDVRVSGGHGKLRAVTRSGDISMEGFNGQQVGLESVSGSIHIEAGAPQITLRTTSGDVVGRLRSCREMRVQTVSGDVKMEVEALPGASLEAHSASGDIELSAAGSHGLQVQMESASGDLDCHHSLNRVQEGRGSIRGVRGDGSVSIHLSSASGDITLR